MKSKCCSLLLCLFLVASCKDKDPDADCGCNGPTVRTIDNAKASFLGSGRLLLRLRSTDDVEYEELYQLCSEPDSLIITPDITNPDYTVSGKVKNNCFSGPTLVIQAQLFEISEIRKKL
jgi:hypothetical protein